MNLEGKEVRVNFSPDESKRYIFAKRAGAGAKAVTWKVKDHFGWPFAIKFVARSEYFSHSIDAELHKARELGSLFAQIYGYGDPVIDDPEYSFLTEDTYAVVVEWVEGQTFQKFCSAESETFDINHFLVITKELCEALGCLKQSGLSHSDLHDENIMIIKRSSTISNTEELSIKIIDTGSLMTEDFLQSLLEKWQRELDTLSRYTNSPDVSRDIYGLREKITWFERGDQAWIAHHLCTLVNFVRRNESRLPLVQRKFFQNITSILKKMVDQDRTMRLDKSSEMFQTIEMFWKSLVTPSKQPLVTPFDLISAELIRSNDQLNYLFSEKCPWIESCATTDPVYIYGPRGCGKSTILRKLSLPAVLASKDPGDLFTKIPYIGVYISCSSELRSRFWLFPKEQYSIIQADVISFFTIILMESLLEAFEALRDGEIEKFLGQSVGLTKETERSIASIICERFNLTQTDGNLGGVSWLTYARKKLAIKKNEIWKTILHYPAEKTPNPALLFDVCKELEQVFPLLKEKNIAFLIDDYSNQRIPADLQRMLNQTISFAKQGNPIFKVSSEYQGVDLEGIQEGREVIEVNLGKEYVTLTETGRSIFLEDVLNIRFKQAKVNTTIDALLGRSNLKPLSPMAREILRCHEQNESFYYHGIDTISDICSGDLAMALDLVKKIYMDVKGRFPLVEPVSPKRQHEIIHQYSDREHSYNFYLPRFGKKIAEIADRLCWLAHQAVIECKSSKDRKSEPMVKTHLDIPLSVVRSLPIDAQELLREMQRKGVIFSLDTSRSRIANDGTDRYQIRRILLVRYLAPLGRRDPIKMDNSQKLLHLLQEPAQFVKSEIVRSVYGNEETAEQGDFFK